MKKLKILATLLCMSALLSSCSILDEIFKETPIENNSQQTLRNVLEISYDGNKINENDTIEIEAYYDFYFNATIDGEAAKIKSITAEDNSVVVTHSRSFYPRKEGETKITIVCTKQEFIDEFTRTFTVRSKYNGEIDSIYVPSGASGITVDSDNNVNITGKVFVKYQNGKTRYVGKDNLLVTEVSNSTKENHKLVKLSYTLNDKTVEASYDVPLNNKNPIEKTTLKQGFDEYYENGYYSNRGHVPTKGDVNVLAIPVWFTDSNEYINDQMVDQDGKNQKVQVIEDLNEALFGDPIRKNDYSLKKYYQEESFGELNIDGKVSEWFECNYSAKDNLYADLSYRENLLEDAYDWYTVSYPEDNTEYDCVMLLYGSNMYGEQYSHTAFATKMTNTYKGISDYIVVSALSIYDMNVYTENILEMSDLSDNVNNDSLFPQTIIHEFAHTMGAIDLYGDSRLTGVTTRPAGIHTMQSDDFGGHDPYHMLAFNYVDPYVLSADKDYGSDSIELTFNDLHSSGDVVILTPHWNDYDSPFDEYIVLELYAQTSINYAFNTYKTNESGIVVYHVDSRLFDLNSYELTSDATSGRTVIPFNNSTGVSHGPSISYPVLNNYQDYHLVHLIRKLDTDSKGNPIDYETTDWGQQEMWFRKGDSFNMSDFASQFYEEGKFDDGESTLGWTFEILDLQVNEYNAASATVRFTKEK